MNDAGGRDLGQELGEGVMQGGVAFIIDENDGNGLSGTVRCSRIFWYCAACGTHVPRGAEAVFS